MRVFIVLVLAGCSQNAGYNTQSGASCWEEPAIHMHDKWVCRGAGIHHIYGDVDIEDLREACCR